MASNISKAGIPLDTAAILALTLECILYGFSVLMFGGTVFALLRGRSKKEVNRGMLTVASLLLVFSTAHVIIEVVRTQDGLVKYRNTFVGGPNAFFADIAQMSFVVKNVVYVAQTLIGDGVVIYRCYVVWQSAWVVIVPILGWCGVLATGIGAPYAVSQATTQAQNIFSKITAEWITAFYIATFSTNLLSTALLAYRVWTINKKAAGTRVSTGLRPVIAIILDAGLLYSAALLVNLVCFARESNGQYVAIDMVCPIISIAFYMIIIRVGMENLRSPGADTMNVQTMSRRTGSGRHPVQVHIDRLSETDGASYAMSEYPKSGPAEAV